jgi:hypothetical protein
MRRPSGPPGGKPAERPASGIFGEPARSASDYQQYHGDELTRVRFIPPPEELTCSLRFQELKRMERVLAKLAASCTAGEATAECPIREILYDTTRERSRVQALILQTWRDRNGFIGSTCRQDGRGGLSLRIAVLSRHPGDPGFPRGDRRRLPRQRSHPAAASRPLLDGRPLGAREGARAARGRPSAPSWYRGRAFDPCRHLRGGVVDRCGGRPPHRSQRLERGRSAAL